MSLALIFLDGSSTPVSASSGPSTPTYVAAIHPRHGVWQKDVAGISGAGLAMWGWLRGLSFG